MTGQSKIYNKYIAFINANFPYLRRKYLMYVYKSEIYKTLKIFINYKGIYINEISGAQFLCLEYNWPPKKSVFLIGVCIYCNLISYD